MIHKRIGILSSILPQPDNAQSMRRFHDQSRTAGTLTAWQSNRKLFADVSLDFWQQNVADTGPLLDPGIPGGTL
jgi:hypothetical protein